MLLMFKIKLLILLLVSIFLSACVNSDHNENRVPLSVDYISGEYDGLLLSNKLKIYLNNFGLLDKNSNLKIRASISHTQNLFITNIDNTSDRERVESNVVMTVYDENFECDTFKFSDSISQFYVLASSDNFLSNKTALDEIKDQNTEYFVKKFINNIKEVDFVCDE